MTMNEWEHEHGARQKSKSAEETSLRNGCNGQDNSGFSERLRIPCTENYKRREGTMNENYISEGTWFRSALKTI